VNGPDVFRTKGRGRDIDAIRMNALDQARDLYGRRARLEIAHTDSIHTGALGGYWAYVTVRCLDYPAEDL
jgi:hypothetical protein